MAKRTRGDEPPLVYFLCVGNAMRSQMAEAFMRHHAGNRVRVASAGTHPASRVFPEVIAVMQECGISLDGHAPKPIDPNVATAATRIVDLGGRAAPLLPRALAEKLEEWEIADPYGSPTKTLRDTRDEIEARVKRLAEELERPGAAGSKRIE